MTGIALPPVKGDVRPLYCYTSCGFALQGLMLPRTVSREGNLSDFQASKEASSPSNLFYVDSMWILCPPPSPPLVKFEHLEAALLLVKL